MRSLSLQRFLKFLNATKHFQIGVLFLSYLIEDGLLSLDWLGVSRYFTKLVVEKSRCSCFITLGIGRVRANGSQINPCRWIVVIVKQGSISLAYAAQVFLCGGQHRITYILEGVETFVVCLVFTMSLIFVILLLLTKRLELWIIRLWYFEIYRSLMRFAHIRSRLHYHINWLLYFFKILIWGEIGTTDSLSCSICNIWAFEIVVGRVAEMLDLLRGEDFSIEIHTNGVERWLIRVMETACFLVLAHGKFFPLLSGLVTTQAL